MSVCVISLQCAILTIDMWYKIHAVPGTKYMRYQIHVVPDTCGTKYMWYQIHVVTCTSLCTLYMYQIITCVYNNLISMISCVLGHHITSFNTYR